MVSLLKQPLSQTSIERLDNKRPTSSSVSNSVKLEIKSVKKAVTYVKSSAIVCERTLAHKIPLVHPKIAEIMSDWRNDISNLGLCRSTISLSLSEPLLDQTFNLSNIIFDSCEKNVNSELVISLSDSTDEVEGCSIKKVVQKVHDLYLTNRQKFVIQTDSGYATVLKPLSNYMIEQHLLCKRTIGVFSGSQLSKFICFDIDMKERSDETTKQILKFLIENLNFNRNSILISKSGLKGYHLEIFFDSPKKLDDLYLLYDYVLSNLNLFKHEVEFRPSYTQAVKLPLSFNLKNNSFCHFVDDDLNILNTKKQELFNVAPANTLPNQIFSTIPKSISHLSDICNDSSTIFDKFTDSQRNFMTVSAINPNAIDFDKHAKDVIAYGHLIFENTRYKATISCLNYLVRNNFTIEDAIEIIKDVIRNTFENHRHLINHKTTLEFALSEVQRLSVYVDSASQNNDEWLPELTKEEIKFILSTKKFNHKAVLLALFLHWVRLGQRDSFYMTYSQINDYLGSLSKQNSLIHKDLLALEEQNMIKIISSNQKQKGSFIKKPNVYSINFKSDYSIRDSIKKLHIKNIDDLIRELPKLFKEDEIKSLVSKKQYYEKFKPSFKIS